MLDRLGFGIDFRRFAGCLFGIAIPLRLRAGAIIRSEAKVNGRDSPYLEETEWRSRNIDDQRRLNNQGKNNCIK